MSVGHTRTSPYVPPAYPEGPDGRPLVPPTPTHRGTEAMLAANRLSLEERNVSVHTIREETEVEVEIELETVDGEGASPVTSTIRHVTDQITDGIDHARRTIEDGTKKFDEFGNEIGNAAEQTGDAIDQRGQTVEQTVDRVQDVADRIQKRSLFQRLFSCICGTADAIQDDAGQRQVTHVRNGTPAATGTLSPRAA
ncbi:hypothetical protein ACUSIJ_07360 [Pseudochelatococcus sp. B33]